ncbi:hypothetical protein GGI21_002270, partial [Coemansia aciculifera]
AKPGYLPKLTGGGPPSSIGGTKPLFGGASSGGRPASSFFGAGRSGPSSAASPTKPLYQPSPPASPVQEPARSAAAPPPATAYKSQQEERQAELDALRKGSRGQSPVNNVSRGATPTLPLLSAGSRLGAGTPPTEPSAQFSQADQTKNELEMLRSRRLLNSSLGGSSGPASSADGVAAERKAELEALRRSRGGSQSSQVSLSPAPPTHSWNQAQSPTSPSQQQQQQQQQQQAKQREEEEERRLRQQEQDAAKAVEEERQRNNTPSAAALSRGPLARAVYDYDAEAEDELAFKEGEIIYSVDQLDPGWWAGESEDGLRHGVFPANFVEMLEDTSSGNSGQVPPARSMPPPHPPAAPMAPPPPPMAPVAPPPPPMAPPPPIAPMAPPPPPMAPPPPPMAPAAPPPPPMAPPAPSLPPLEKNGAPLFVARAMYKGGLHPGKAGRHIENGGCAIGFGHKEVNVREYQILCGDASQVRWVKQDGQLNIQGFKPVECGHEESGEPLYIAKTMTEGSQQLGKCAPHIKKGMSYPYGHKELTTENYMVLAYTN